MATPLDPRLASRDFLRLAALAALYRRQQGGLPPWLEGEGLAALLAYARHPYQPEAPEPGPHGLAGLLAEARQFLGKEPPA